MGQLKAVANKMWSEFNGVQKGNISLFWGKSNQKKIMVKRLLAKVRRRDKIQREMITGICTWYTEIKSCLSSRQQSKFMKIIKADE